MLHAGDACATLVVHAVPGVAHWPLGLQLSTFVPEHVVCPGAHTPEQTPAAHVWATHADAPLHVPSDWQVTTPLLEDAHCVCPGAHTPVHPPETQAWLLHPVAFCHVPLVLQL